MNLLVDNMNNSFNQSFGAWPEKGCIFMNQKLVLMVDPNNELFWVNSLRIWLSQHLDSHSTPLSS